MEEITIRQIASTDSEWIRRLLRDRWGSSVVISRGQPYNADELFGFVASEGAERIGLITYSIDGPECEIVTLDSLKENRGVGSALLKVVESAARHARCKYIRVITTNDNLNALGFYQRRGFVLVALHRDAVERSRSLKSEIPLTGNDGIPIRDELELELHI